MKKLVFVVIKNNGYNSKYPTHVHNVANVGILHWRNPELADEKNYVCFFQIFLISYYTMSFKYSQKYLSAK